MRPAAIDDRRARLARYTTWTKAELDEFEQALGEQRVIDLERPHEAWLESEHRSPTRPA